MKYVFFEGVQYVYVDYTNIVFHETKVGSKALFIVGITWELNGRASAPTHEVRGSLVGINSQFG